MPKANTQRRRSRAIVRGHLEKISSGVFDHYKDQITNLIGTRHGVYALYRRDRLYYMGLATDLKRRISHHLKDRHKGKWDRFSLYMIRKEDHIREVEALLVRIAGPSGNRVRGKLGRSRNLLPVLKKIVSSKAKEEIETLFGATVRTGKHVAGSARRMRASRSREKKRRGRKPQARGVDRPLKGFFPTGKVLYATYKGKDYKAFVYRSGTIKMDGKSYYNPTAASVAITGTSKNGWHFWKYKDKSGELQFISRLRR